MSRKTKEEKKLAEYRRRLKFMQINQPQIGNQVVTKSPPFSTEQKFVQPVTKIDTVQQNYFRQDLKKSLAYILLIITLEIVIYFVRMNRYF